MSQNGNRGKLFEYAVLFHPKPTKDQLERGETSKSEVLVKPTSTLAVDDKQVAIVAARSIPDTHLNSLEDIEIVVRPF